MRPDGNGKGDKPRPLGVPLEQFDKNFEAIFGKKPVKTEPIPFAGMVEVEDDDFGGLNDNTL